MVPPGLSAPEASAASTILTAMRSLALPPGLRYSTLAATVADPGVVTELSLTSGVLPMRSTMWSAMGMSSLLHPRCRHDRGRFLDVELGYGTRGEQRLPDRVPRPAVDAVSHPVRDVDPWLHVVGGHTIAVGDVLVGVRLAGLVVVAVVPSPWTHR